MPEFQSHPPIDAGIPVTIPSGTHGRFDCLNPLSGCYGVYIFRRTRTRRVLYVGQSDTQGLDIRIRQHYQRRDTGGNFRINYCEIHCNLQRCGNVRGQDKKACGEEPETSCEELLSFQCFKQLLELSEILAFSVANDEILAVEYDLIDRLEPMYTNLPENVPAGVECVNDTVCSIIHSLETPAGD